MAGTVEAIIGAVYLDGDMKCVTQVMQNLGLMPRLVRRTGPKVPASESAKSLPVSTSTGGNNKEPELASRDPVEGLVTVMKSSQELDKSLHEYSTAVQLKQLLDESVQSPM